mmetsp:Transcript_139574/g.242922  ORF Transcript_139574/g.242922 Transcript_139574/m.242922 type:complete len:89 (-) Transcript_139574:205-471(-)
MRKRKGRTCLLEMRAFKVLNQCHGALDRPQRLHRDGSLPRPIRDMDGELGGFQAREQRSQCPTACSLPPEIPKGAALPGTRPTSGDPA